MDKLQVFQTMATDIARGPVEFSSGARQALGLRSALADPSCHTSKAAQLIAAEPVLAARVVALANSLAYNPQQREIHDLPTAVARLGFATLRNLCMALFTKRLTDPSLPLDIQQMADQLWQHTTQVAALARVIARRVTHVDPEAALFAGVMHEVAGFYLLNRAPRHPGISVEEIALLAQASESDPGSTVVTN